MYLSLAWIVEKWTSILLKKHVLFHPPSQKKPFPLRMDVLYTAPQKNKIFFIVFQIILTCLCLSFLFTCWLTYLICKFCNNNVAASRKHTSAVMQHDFPRESFVVIYPLANVSSAILPTPSSQSENYLINSDKNSDTEMKSAIPPPTYQSLFQIK